MNMFFLAILLFVGSGIALVLAVVVWTHRPAPGIVPLTLLMLAGTIWVMACGFEISADELSARILWTKISYLGVSSAGVFWLIFTMDYSGSSWWKRPGNLILISFFPLATLIIVWTNDLYHLEWSNIYLTEIPLGVISIWEQGRLYYMTPITQYVLYLAGIIILARFGFRHKGIYRKQTIIILTGTMIPVIGNIIYAFRVNIAGGMDVTPFYVAVSVIIYGVAILLFRFPDIVPVARKAINDNSPDGFIILDNQEFIIEVNHVVEEITGTNAAQIQGKTLTSSWPDLHKLISGRDDILHAELKVENDDTTLYLDIGAVTLYDNHRKKVGRLIVTRDVTELKNTQRELEILYEKEHDLADSLEKEISRRTQYTRALVHELGTPLTAIVASGDLLDSLVVDKTHMRLVKSILRASQNLEQRIKELLDLARGELGMLEISTELIDMNQLVREVADEMMPVSSEKGIDLIVEYYKGEIPAMADKKRLRQVLFNLISNALKFTRQGKITIRTGRNDPDLIVVEVEDTGIGMDEAQLRFLFDPYYSKSREDAGASGLGIGLTLSKMFIELHNGEIQVRSTRGKGSTFRFTLPAAN